MKKYKVYFSFANILGETQAEVVKLQKIFQGLTASIAFSTWYADNADHAMVVGVIGMFADLILGCFYFEEVKPETPPQL